MNDSRLGSATHRQNERSCTTDAAAAQRKTQQTDGGDMAWRGDNARCGPWQSSASEKSEWSIHDL